jgi:uncharacterized surface protein with fasciclin (FAS1) repeats
MNSIKNKIKTGSFLMASAVMVLSACNKGVLDIPEPVVVPPAGLSVAETLAATPTDSLFNRMVIKSGMVATLSNKALTYTVFVPDNAAIIASFGSLAAANGTIAALPATSLASIVKYHMLPQKLTSAQIVHGYPNLQRPTDIILDPTNALVRLSAFPSKSPLTTLASTFYYNNAPIIAADATAGLSTIHHIAFIASPPSRLLKDTIGRVANLTYFKAAITRADSGQINLNRFDSLLNYAVTNMTVLAPSDAAFQTLIYGLVYSNVFALTGSAATADAQANGAVALGPAIFQVSAFYSSLSAATVRGILAYHLLAGTNPVTGAIEPSVRVFSVNIPNTPTFVKTLVNSSVAVHPGLLAQATYTGPIATAVKFTGLGTFPPGGAPFSGTAANVIGADRHAVNGVFHIIDRVLLPQ